MTEERRVVCAVDAGVVSEADRRGARLDQVQVSQAAFAELADDVAEMRHSIAVAEAAQIAMRRETHRDAILADIVSHAVHHLEEQPRAVLDRTPVGVASLVAAILQELIEKEAIGSMNFDSVEPGCARVTRSLAEVGDDSRKLARFQRARGFIRQLLERRGVSEAGRRDRRRRDRQAAIGIVGGVRPTAVMDDLQHEPAAPGMHSLGDEPPPSDLFGVVHSGHLRIAVSLNADRGRLGDVQPGGRALTVIFSIERGGTPPGPARIRVNGGITIRFGSESAPS
jgi:hypothetical protein